LLKVLRHRKKTDCSPKRNRYQPQREVSREERRTGKTSSSATKGAASLHASVNGRAEIVKHSKTTIRKMAPDSTNR